MSFSIDDIRRLAHEAARAASPSIRVAGVTVSDSASSAYLEIMMIVEGCSEAGCVIDVKTVATLTDPALRLHLTRELQQHLRDHGRDF